MKAPDKIYLHRTTGNHRLNGKVYPYKPAKIRDDDKIIEYIRKDAILEWAKEMEQNRLMGYIMFDELINKINSL